MQQKHQLVLESLRQWLCWPAGGSTALHDFCATLHMKKARRCSLRHILNELKKDEWYHVTDVIFYLIFADLLIKLTNCDVEEYNLSVLLF